VIGTLEGATSGGSMSVVTSSMLAVGAGSSWLCSAWICRQTSFADSPIPLSVTSSRAIAVGMSSSSSSDCNPFSTELTLHGERNQQLFAHEPQAR
jgi:hypothetical protein